MIDHSRNWAGNQLYNASQVHLPETLEEIQRIVAASSHVKAIGARHSFSPIGVTSGDLIAMQRFNRIESIDEEQMTVTVQAGAPYASFCAALHQAGYAVHNMASLPQISVGGACATATHGSGDNNGNLATAVSALRMVTADGDVVHLSRDSDDFQAVVVGLGGFGVITHLTLDIRPAYSIRQDIYENLPVSALANHFDQIMAEGYSVSLFTDWQGDTINQLWIKQVCEVGTTPAARSELYGAQLAEVTRHPVSDGSADICNDQLGKPGPWHERLPHFRVDGIGQTGNELQTEYFVAREHAPAALQTISEIQDHLAPIIRTSEIRTVAEDNIWMSPSYQSACVGLHFTWRASWDAVRERLPYIEQQLEPFQPRPHWGKLFIMSPDEVQSRFPRIHDFRNCMKRYDPSGKFRNEFLDTYIFGD